jgi:tRNA A37 threonylcarbamoyladenosine modification protein TsaB
MTKILAIDTSGPTGILAVSDGTRFMDIRFSSSTGLRPNIVELASRLLRDFGLESNELTNLVVGVGPGKFIRTRVGIAFINGIAATTNLPITPIDSLAVLGYTCVANLHKIGVVREETKGKLIAAFGLINFDNPLYNPGTPWRNAPFILSPSELSLYSKETVEVWAMDGDIEEESIDIKYNINLRAAHVHCDAKAKSLIRLAEEGIKRNRFTRIAVPDYIKRSFDIGY